MDTKNLVTCNICKRTLARHKCMLAQAVRPGLAKHISDSRPDWNPEGFICLQDLRELRAEYVERMLASGRGDLSRMEADVVKSLRDEELLTHQILEESQETNTFGQRTADQVARFGGSWRFLISFAFFMAFWIVLNIVVLVVFHGNPFDPYPFILLNLCLSCLAAVQAPVIMMSQNRLEARDRKRAENDYRINLKAELEIRHLHDKLDHLLEHQWQHLMEIQEVQIELMEEISSHRRVKPDREGN